jgi:predicted nuclease with TOPRIM domain
MSDQPHVTTTAFLTAEHVEQWKAERSNFADRLSALKGQVEQINAEMTQITAEIAKRDQMLRNAVPFVPGLAEWLDSIDPETIALTDAIKRVLQMHHGQPLNREIIKQILPRTGYVTQKLNANPNYFYTALKRLVDRQQIIESPPGHFRLK